MVPTGALNGQVLNFTSVDRGASLQLAYIYLPRQARTVY